MKFPSLKALAENTFTTVKRFPFEFLFALAGTVSATILIHRDYYSADSTFTKLIMTANLGLLLSLATSLWLESTGTKKIWLFKAFVALMAACFFFIFHVTLTGIDYTRFFLLSLGFHLLISFAAFTSKNNVNGFWQFNKTLFLRIRTSLLFSFVLYLGLAAAIATTRFLFSLNFSDKFYGYLFAWIAGIFNTLLFLAGIPENTRELENDNSYPKGLKIFSQDVLIPLATVYLLILLVYEVKILIQWSLPKGMVSNLILGYAVFGLLSILLVYPLREQRE